MSRGCDIVVVGGGANGLTAATLLARAGREVALVEARETLGGLAAGEEFAPGYRSAGVTDDTAALRASVVRELELQRHGLRLLERQPPVLVPEAEGNGLLLERDPSRAAQELGRLSATELDSYRTWRRFLERIAPMMRRLLDEAPPPLEDLGPGDLFQLGRKALALRLLGRDDLLELLRVATMGIGDWLRESFESELLRAALAAPALHHAFAGPWSPGTAATLLRRETLAGRPVSGGPRSLVAALEKAAREARVDIRTGSPVAALVLRGSAVRGVELADGTRIEAPIVAASCHPRHLLLDLVHPRQLPMGLEQSLLNYRCRGMAAKVHLALTGYPEIRCRRDLKVSRLRIGESLVELEQAFDAAKYRRLSEQPLLEIQVPTLENPGLAPAGHHVFSILVHFAPRDLEGGWTPEAKEDLLRRVVERLDVYFAGVEQALVAGQVLTPADLEAEYRIEGGHLLHGEEAIDQLAIRPVPECYGYRTPFPGLWLCGSASHPGGGVTCAPGALAARAILRG